jgi:hypothetical protein
VERARAMLSYANLDSSFWAEAVNTANYCKNRSPTVAVNNITPYEAWTGQKPDLAHMKIFGCLAYMHVPKQQRKKWNDKAKEMIFVGYSHESKGYRLMDPSTLKVTEAKDVIFLETKFINTSESLSNNNSQKNEHKFYDEETVFTIVQPVDQVSPSTSEEREIENLPAQDNDIVRRSNRIIKVPSYLNDYELAVTAEHECNLANIDDVNDYPKTYKEALESSDAIKWNGAILEEIEAHQKNETWNIVNLPSGRKTIKSKWIFKIKEDSLKKSKRYKARLVAKGCAQIPGVDYTETFSPVVRYDTLRVLIALATIHNWEMDHVDAVVAFLQGDIEEEIFMELPEGLEVSKERGVDRLVCRLQKAMYGLKQSGRNWYNKLDENLRKLNLTCANFDNCVYYKIQDNNIVIVAVYVDDLIIFSNSRDLTN